MAGLVGAKALVTGGSSGLGAEICRQLAEAGAVVGIGYRQGADRAEALAGEIGGQAVQIDQSTPEGAEAGVARALEALDGLDVLVNNAGMASGGHAVPRGDLAALTPAIWDEMLAVNLSGPFFVTRAVEAALRGSEFGRVVNIGSTIGEGPWGADAPYAPSKGAVAALTRFLAAALAPDVTVNCVAPGLMQGTAMSGPAPQAYIDAWAARAVTGRTTEIADVAGHVVAFCQGSSATGQVLVVDGGIHFG